LSEDNHLSVCAVKSSAIAGMIISLLKSDTNLSACLTS